MNTSRPASGRYTRRKFLRRAAEVCLIPAFVPAACMGRDGAIAPSNRIGVAAIGLGFAWDTALYLPETRLVAVCDVLRERREQARHAVNAHYGNEDCTAYNDFREVLARRDVDAVYIATPDHWHALITIAAARAGKDIYCQKPLTHSVAEGRAVVEAVRRYGVVLQHGTQHRSEWAFQAARELIRRGYLGQLKTIRLGLPAGAQLPPQSTQPVPDGFDYDLWLGPAPWSPFTSRRCFGVHSWYFISDYCVGYIAGWGVHHLDSGQHGHGADDTGPVRIRSRAIFPTDGLYDTPIHYRVEYEYADGVTMIATDVSDGGWSQGAGIHPDRIREVHGDAYQRHTFGVRFEGDEGSLFVWRGGRLDTTPASLRQLVTHNAPKTEVPNTTLDHFRNWVECIRTRRDPAAPVEVGHRSTTLCNIGTISMVLGRELAWDPVTETFPHDTEANRLLACRMRSPWQL